MIPESRARYGSHYFDIASFYLKITSYFLRDFPDSVSSPAAMGHSSRRENSKITKILSILAAKERLRLKPGAGQSLLCRCFSSAVNGRNEDDTPLQWLYIRSMTSHHFLSRDLRMRAHHLVVIS